MSELNARGLNSAQVLACLYNASRPLGMGFLQYNPTPMTEQEAEELLKKGKYFDYLMGRVMKLDLSKAKVDTWLYDRDNGVGAAQRAVDAYVEKNSAAIEAAHKQGVKEAAESAKESMNTPMTMEGNVINLTLADVKSDLSPKVDEALRAQNIQNTK